MMTPPPGLRVIERAVYRGPHLYSRRPMIRLQLELGHLEHYPTDRLPGFTASLLAQLPGLQRHGCSLGRPGGLVERMTAGTWLGHIIEHVALELQAMAGCATTRGKTRSVRGCPGVYNVLYVYEDEIAGLMAGRFAIELVDRLLPEALRGASGLETLWASSAADVADAVNQIRQAVQRCALGPSTAALVAAARRRRIPVERLDDRSLIQLGWGRRQRRIRASVTDRTGLIAAESAGDKAAAKALLEALAVPVARGRVVRSAEEAVAAARALKSPWVVKPLNGNHGRGVVVGITEVQGVVTAFDGAAKHSRRVLIEEQLPGADHRILVVDGRVVAVAERRAAEVVGDGRRTVAELVEGVNADPRRGEGHSAVLTRIRLGEAALDLLRRQGLTSDSVPSIGQRVALHTAANLSAGGTAIDRTAEIHPDNAAMARRAALAVGLDVAGVDFMAPDIARSVRETGGGVVEVNAAPGLRMHLAPSEGLARDVADPIIAMLYPRGRPSRIPILAVTGTNGKSTVGRMAAHILKSQGLTVGLTNTSGVYVGEERLKATDASGPRSARMVLRDPTVDAAVLECARGGILREGLAFDYCDVGAVLNVQPDHLGLKGVDTLDDLATVKSVVVESVARRGVSVLNADDPHTIRMARHARGRLCWFSMRGGDDAPGFLLKHLAGGGLAVTYDPATNLIHLREGDERRLIIDAREIPATFGGAALFNIANALAAAAMAYGVGVSPEDSGRALATFASDYSQNPGRMNLHEARGVRTILDYAHNPDAMRALGAAVARLKPEGGRSIAMVSIPGDRRDTEIRAMGEISAELFDQVVFRETPDGRGRPRGEVMRLLMEGARAAGCPAERLTEVYEELDAARLALDMAQPGDVVVLTPTRVEAVWALVQSHRPVAARPPKPFEPLLEPPHG